MRSETDRRRRRSRLGALFALTAIMVAAAALMMPTLTGRLDSGGWIPAGAESVAVDNRLAAEFDRRATSHVAMLTAGDTPLDTVAARRELARISHELLGVTGVTAVYTPYDAPTAALRASLVSEDGDAWLVVIQVDNDLPTSIGHIPAIERALVSTHFDTRLTGVPALSAAFGDQVKADLLRAELLALPIALLVLARFAGGTRAALAIVLATVNALSISTLLLAAASQAVDVSIFALSTVALLTIALSLDLGLLAALRRDERYAGRHVRATIHVAIAAVAVGMAGLALLPIASARSIGVAGVVAVLVVGLCQRYLLPSWMSALRADHAEPSQRHGHRADTRPVLRSRSLAAVGRHPIAALLFGVVVLLPLIVPITRMDITGPGISMLPDHAGPAATLHDIATRFPDVPITPITVVVTPVDGTMLEAGNLLELKQASERITTLPGVESVRTVWDLVPGGISSPMLTASLALDPTLVDQARPLLTGTGAVIEIGPAAGTGQPLVELIRARAGALGEGELRFQVGGADAASVDLATSVGEVSLPALAMVLLATVAVLALAFHSVLLPLKAVLLNALPVLAGLGAVTWLFQVGTPWTSGSGELPVVIPLVLGWLMFGISMDYEVFMLARIREARDRGLSNREATLLGVESARPLVSRGAVLMGIVFLAFASSDVLVVRAIGVGLLVAILVDATVVRLVLLPATMLLLGRWNWWWPQRLPSRDARLPSAVAAGDGQ